LETLPHILATLALEQTMRRRLFSCANFGTRLSTFFGCRGGNTIMLFGLAFVPVMFALGSAVDYGRAAQTRTALQTTVDQATLAGAGALFKGGDATQTAKNYVAQRFAYTGTSTTTNVTVDANQGTVTVNAAIALPTAIMKIAHIDAIPVTANAKAAIGAGGGGATELAIAFDTTGSMAQGGRLDTAKAAAKDLINRVMKLPNGATNPKVKVALAPFTRYVNVGTTYRGANWLTNTTDYTETQPQYCYNDYPDAVYASTPIRHPGTCYSDGTPYDCGWDEWPVISLGTPVQKCYTPTYTHTWYGCVGSQDSPLDEKDLANAGNKVPALFDYGYDQCPATPIMRLGANQNALNAAIDSFTPNGETYIAPGLVWAWRLLSPNPPFGDGAGNGAARKIIVLMTDGANTASASYPLHGGTDVAGSNSKLINVCTAAKAAGVTLYTIAFQVTDSTIQSVLSSCATGTPYYYNAQTNSDLQAAFTSIGQQLTNLRLVQ
jgi:Flp pilus assembly protein TadG